MGMGPVSATRCAWKGRLDAGRLDLLEINEALAASAAVNKEMGWDTSKINVTAAPSPSATRSARLGARILVTLIHEMMRRDEGLASLCIGGGMGVALAIERARPGSPRPGAGRAAFRF
jgi:acetyl-CoA C-acetyltransferase